ncbi:hypothetical protein CYLTODRAFT_418213 [Cylindrobasidium torrendii FP15055 ss-10]|uniref:Uncharacterized protein n=1 Tax=Cylindrobasidium torrendii FP15055 ss-10 TaxID=1314674 RepID=A0A0D7BPA4_9AGAR|nr:hypothetical protein CYLTODRAFT_418213 [Cylindrobasidium torrendii FP15055 ss-10]
MPLLALCPASLPTFFLPVHARSLVSYTLPSKSVNCDLFFGCFYGSRPAYRPGFNLLIGWVMIDSNADDRSC